jgi:hypothetical protein
MMMEMGGVRGSDRSHPPLAFTRIRETPGLILRRDPKQVTIPGEDRVLVVSAKSELNFFI